MFSPLLAVLCLCATVVATLTPNLVDDSWAIQDQFEGYNELKDNQGSARYDISRNVKHIRTKRDDIIGPEIGRIGGGGFRPYCSQTELCCGKRVFRGLFDYGAQCCGQDYIDSNTARCCNGIVHLADDYNIQCCGRKLYDQRKQVCCSGKTYNITKNQQCCGSQVYFPKQQICCNGRISDINNKVLSCCKETPYEPARSHCINGVIHDNPINSDLTQICGDQIIDYKTKICCQGRPQDRTYGTMTICCGALAISAATQLCCNGTIITDPGDGSVCCKNKIFNQGTQVCCNGNVIARPQNSVGDTSYCNRAQVFAAARAYSPYFTCCDTELLTDYSTQMCCDNKLYTYNTNDERGAYSCCGSQAYNTAQQTCCTDTLVQGASTRCCGRRAYNLNHQVCCAGDLFKHDAVPTNKCCTASQTVQPFPIAYE